MTSSAWTLEPWNVFEVAWHISSCLLSIGTQSFSSLSCVGNHEKQFKINSNKKTGKANIITVVCLCFIIWLIWTKKVNTGTNKRILIVVESFVLKGTNLIGIWFDIMRYMHSRLSNYKLLFLDWELILHNIRLEKYFMESTDVYTDSTKINRPGNNIRMYWTNFRQPTAHVQQNIFGKTSI